jgi:alkaline phosphatase
MIRPNRALLFTSVAACIAACAPTAARISDASLPQQSDAYFKAGAARAANLAAQQKRARNVILFIGDGMGVATVTAARIYAGQQQNVDGESYELTMDTFPHLAHSRTYSDDHQITDSAAGVTAMTTGVKTRSGMLGLTNAAHFGVCEDESQATAETLFELAEAAGLSTGVVTTTRITHATPAGVYAHIAHRDWENDAVAALGGGANCVDIARQLVEWPAGDGLEIALGGGRANFLPNSAADPENAAARGARADGRDLTAEWAAKPGHAFVWNAAQLAAADLSSASHVLGLFSPSHMAYESQRSADAGGEPSLAEMTRAAIGRLQQDHDGYVLMVEGGRIDHAHHEGRAREALSETVAFDAAVRAALDMTSRDDTLIVVTADHSHVLTISGYAARGTSILGLSTDEERGGTAHAADGRPYTTLGYINGPGAAAPSAEGRPDISSIDTSSFDYRQQALVPLLAETHGGEDVTFYAWGPGDSAFTGTIEQNVSFHLMARALGLAE